MPGKFSEDSKDLDTKCARCQVDPGTIVVRAEHLCRECFMNYIGSKVAKRMDVYKVRTSTTDKKRRLLLPLSFGVSSVTLLHILDQLLQIQKERIGRAGFELHVIHVLDASTVESNPAVDAVATAKERYPLHTYTIVRLDEVYESSNLAENNISASTTSLIRQSGLPPLDSTFEKLQEFLTSLPSASSRADMIITLRTRLIVRFAKQMGCESIIWGDSTTRLAERTLAETAKGRGFSIPWQTIDGLSPYGINFNFPMRDLLRKEIVTYSSLPTPPLKSLLVGSVDSLPALASSKDATIDNLMAQFFESVEQSYPSIVANVVRTSGRLQAPLPSKSTTVCRLCSLPIAHGAQGLYGWNGDQGSNRDVTAFDSIERGRLVTCYGCSRALGDPKRLAFENI